MLPLYLSGSFRWIVAGLLSAIALTIGVLVILSIELHLTVEPVADRMWVLEDRSANAVLLANTTTAVLVDTKHWRHSIRLKREIDKLTKKPIRYIINTHHHPDHVDGNPLFLPGPEVIMTENARRRLLERFSLVGARPEERAAIPERGVAAKDTPIDIGTQIIHVVQVGRGHTDGDCVVYFPLQHVVVAGDLFYNGYYPEIDAASGGSALAWIDAIDRIIALGPELVIPGHGEPAGVAELKAFQGYLKDLIREVARLKDDLKLTRAEVAEQISLPVHSARLKPLDERANLTENAKEVFDELAAGARLPQWPTFEFIPASEVEDEKADADGMEMETSPGQAGE